MTYPILKEDQRKSSRIGRIRFSRNWKISQEALDEYEKNTRRKAESSRNKKASNRNNNSADSHAIANAASKGIDLNYAKIIYAMLVAAVLLAGCTSPSQAPGTNDSQSPTISSQTLIKGTLAADQNGSIVLSYDRLTHQAVIEAVRYMDADQAAQLPFSCAIGSTFLVLINDARIYGESGRVNGTYQVRVPWTKFEKYVAASGLTKAEFDAMNVTSAAIRFKARENDAVIGECVNLKNQKITLDGKELKEKEITESAQSGIRTGTS